MKEPVKEKCVLLTTPASKSPQSQADKVEEAVELKEEREEEAYYENTSFISTPCYTN